MADFLENPAHTCKYSSFATLVILVNGMMRYLVPLGQQPFFCLITLNLAAIQSILPLNILSINRHTGLSREELEKLEE